MKTISTGLSSHLAGEATTLATCWKMTLRDTTVKAFTDHNTDLVVDSIIYKASSGFTPGVVELSDSLSVDNISVQGVIDSTAILEEDIIAGKYDFAEVEIFKVNYSDLTQGKVNLSRGWIGEVQFGKKYFTAELVGLTRRLSKNIGDIYSASCRAKLGDSRCKVNMASYTVTGTATTVTTKSKFTDTSRSEADGYFNFGKIKFTSGANNNIEMEVKEYRNKEFSLALPMPYDIGVGDSYSLEAGCDKTFETCMAKFNNAVNFRGEPHVPGTDRILQTSGTRTDWE